MTPFPTIPVQTLARGGDKCPNFCTKEYSEGYRGKHIQSTLTMGGWGSTPNEPQSRSGELRVDLKSVFLISSQFFLRVHFLVMAIGPNPLRDPVDTNSELWPPLFIPSLILLSKFSINLPSNHIILPSHFWSYPAFQILIQH